MYCTTIIGRQTTLSHIYGMYGYGSQAWDVGYGHRHRRFAVPVCTCHLPLHRRHDAIAIFIFAVVIVRLSAAAMTPQFH